MAAKLHKKWGIVMVNRKCISVVDLLMSKLLERKEKVKVKLCMSRIVKTRYVLIAAIQNGCQIVSVCALYLQVSETLALVTGKTTTLSDY